MNPLLELRNQGQSVWLDYIRRDLIVSGEFRALVENDGLRGVTSNPTIFEKAIDAGTDYDAAIAGLVSRHPGITAQEIYDALAIEDVQNAADILRPAYDESGGTDGFVSIEPPPQLTHDTPSTVSEVRRVWHAVARPNVMVKVAGTREGVRAVEILIAEGININITLMFSLQHYEDVAGAYIRGLQQCARPEKVASVASFFVSRIDTQVDRALEANGSDEALALRGRIAIANAKLAYRRYREIFHGDAFAEWRARGAHVQRPLWASTSTKNPNYRDVLYIEELIGPETVNTMPPATLEAFRDHGQIRGATLLEGLTEAEQELAALSRLGIDLNAISERLQEDGNAAFAESYSKVLAALDRKRNSMTAAPKHSFGA